MAHYSPKVIERELQLISRMTESPIFFIESMWQLRPQKKGEKFLKNEHITWQQTEILQGIEKAIAGAGQNRISVASGHGIGKTAVLSWILLWFLFTHKHAQVACTAPSREQMHDVLWKEAKIWIDRMPEAIKPLYQWTTGYIRISEAPEKWFARARTARKEAPEALAGVHGDHVCFLIDEASGVADEVYRIAEGSLTGENVLVIMISNHTRLVGYFHDSHGSDSEAWQTFRFNSEESPIVDNSFVKRIEKKHGKDSDPYRVQVQGLAPREDAVDDKGYVPLLTASDINQAMDCQFVGGIKLGVDPSGEGDDTTVWVARDEFKAKILAREKRSTPKSIAEKTALIMRTWNVSPNEVYIDNFGVGANVAQELALIGHRVNALNVGERCEGEDEKNKFINKRAMIAWRLKDWIRTGGEFITHEGWPELLTVRYRAELSGKMKVMSKQEMKKDGYPSPNIYDALVLTFLDDYWKNYDAVYEEGTIQESNFDKFSLL